MTKLGKPYGIGVDIGSNSIGFAAVDENSHLIRLKGKTVIEFLHAAKVLGNLAEGQGPLQV